MGSCMSSELSNALFLAEREANTMLDPVWCEAHQIRVYGRIADDIFMVVNGMRGNKGRKNMLDIASDWDRACPRSSYRIAQWEGSFRRAQVADLMVVKQWPSKMVGVDGDFLWGSTSDEVESRC